MRSGRLLSLVAAAVLFATSAGGCAGVKPGATNPDGGGGSSGSGRQQLRRRRVPTSRRSRPAISATCGNGDRWIPARQCDDGNKTPGDGCSAICQIPAGWTCTGTPSVCTMAGVCGDGILGASEACDDKQHGRQRRLLRRLQDGRARLRVPRARSQVRSRLRRRHASSAASSATTGTRQRTTAAPRPARSSRARRCMGDAQHVHGRHLRQRHEGRRARAATAAPAHRPWPSGCKGPNGLFFGDGSGCSKTCTKEPKCRDRGDDAGVRHAAAATATSRRARTATTATCDKGDGCSATCKLEAGFICSRRSQDDTEDCTTGSRRSA